ncbi:hypothetical protein ACFRCG_33195 [Embleya sp. NPDC056575]|uniref:hypothetical protein n=1 Tax=unclassified Embleya TaxID=2699296 RepID=UPI0036AAB27D
MVIGIAAGAVTLGTALPASAAPATREASTVVAQGPVGVLQCFPWSFDEWYGWASGDACRPGMTTATIASKEEGECAFLVVKWWNSNGGSLGSERSPAACDKSSRTWISKAAPRGAARVQVNMGRSSS